MKTPRIMERAENEEAKSSLHHAANGWSRICGADCKHSSLQWPLEAIEVTGDDKGMLSNAETADMHLTLPKDHSLTPGPSPEKKSTQMGNPCKSFALKHIGSTKTFLDKLVTEEVDLDVGEDTVPLHADTFSRVKWNRDLPEGTICKSPAVAGQSVKLSNANSSRARYANRTKPR